MRRAWATRRSTAPTRWPPAAGSGWAWGRAAQKWNWIPEAHNDFIFSILGEELGLAGTLLVLGLFAILAISVFKTIARTTDTFSRIVACSVITWILGQAVINIAMVSGLLPVIGVPLPFISYGGSAMVSSLAGIGVILAVTRPERPGTKSPAKAVAAAKQVREHEYQR
ncbi:FtsW/RodA/SpoVE family cell cycle protein [Arthrobacter sp. SLBN-112]|uniref:FtsW/RodA/SpoVE family cell cycle protein n=1 Tax=Arthrobacter sp. SLBN-112 TaxID=2768452 RepID=UPI0028115A57|nr:FtsW/RodA/SpoVE family cell cycle protein [Arthrobacter sp. SLBN-112]